MVEEQKLFRISAVTGPPRQSARTTAGIDLSLALVGEDHGHETAFKTARFRVMFPCARADKRKDSHTLSHQAVTSRPKKEKRAILADRVHPKFAQKRILCVDDNVVELTLRGKILESQGYSVVLLRCPRQALRCDLSAFDLAVLDFDMPGLNGRDCSCA